jgi:hypothetical protein
MATQSPTSNTEFAGSSSGQFPYTFQSSTPQPCNGRYAVRYHSINRRHKAYITGVFIFNTRTTEVIHANEQVNNVHKIHSRFLNSTGLFSFHNETHLVSRNGHTEENCQTHIRACSELNETDLGSTSYSSSVLLEYKLNGFVTEMRSPEKIN